MTAAASQHAGAVTSGRAGWLRALRFSALVYLGVRLGLFLVGLLSTALLPVREPKPERGSGDDD